MLIILLTFACVALMIRAPRYVCTAAAAVDKEYKRCDHGVATLRDDQLRGEGVKRSCTSLYAGVHESLWD